MLSHLLRQQTSSFFHTDVPRISNPKGKRVGNVKTCYVLNKLWDPKLKVHGLKLLIRACLLAACPENASAAAIAVYLIKCNTIRHHPHTDLGVTYKKKGFRSSKPVLLKLP